MENNLDNLHEDEVIIEDIDVDALETLDETLEQDITEAKVNPKEIDGEDDDDKEDDGEGLDDLGDEDSDVDNDGDSDEADEYLTKRRKTVAKKIAKEDTDMNESEDDIDLTEASPFITHGTNRWRAYYPGAYSGTGYTKYFKDEASAKAWAAKKGHGTKVTKVSDVSKKDHDAIIKKGKEEMQKSGKNTVFIRHGSNTHTVAKINKKGEAGRHQEGGTYVRESLTVDESFESEDITRLIESEEGLTEEFKDKAAIIFEAAVSSKVNEIEATLVEQYESRLAEEVESAKSVLEEQVDSYLTYAVESWMEENKVAVESSLRTQLAENFISALKTVFVENYVDVPDSKVDLFAQLEAENGNLKEESAKFSRIAESLADRVDTLVREQIVTEASTGLADTQVDRLKKLVEDIEFVDAATYRKKVQTIKEFYLNGSQETEDTTLTEGADDSFISTETIVEGESMNDNLSPEMKSYLTALSRMNKAVTADLL